MRTRKQHPCPGCGDLYYRPPTELCPQCKADIEYGRKAHENIEAARKTGDLIMVSIGRQYLYNAPGRPEKYPSTYQNQEPSSYKMMHALKLLINPPPYEHRGFHEAPGQDLYHRRDSYGNHADYDWLLTPEQLVAMKDILEFVLVQSTFKYQDGFRDGRSLLQGLADGTKSIDDYNRITAKLDGDQS